MCRCACGSMQNCGVWRVGGWGTDVKICGRVINKLWGWEELVQGSLWPRLLWILRLGLHVYPDPFHWHLSRLIINNCSAKHDTTLDHVMTRPLISTVFTAVSLWIWIHLVPADSQDVPKVFFLCLRSANKFRVSDTVRIRGSRCKFFLNTSLSANWPTLCSRRASWKSTEENGTEWKEERKKGKMYLLTNLRIL